LQQVINFDCFFIASRISETILKTSLIGYSISNAAVLALVMAPSFGSDASARKTVECTNGGGQDKECGSPPAKNVDCSNPEEKDVNCGNRD
jgi:hypothetical protein